MIIPTRTKPTPFDGAEFTDALYGRNSSNTEYICEGLNKATRRKAFPWELDPDINKEHIQKK